MGTRRVSIPQLERAIAMIGGEASAAAMERAAVREVTRLLAASRATLVFFDAAGIPESVTRYAVGATDDESPVLSAEEAFVRQAYEEARPIIHTPDDLLPFPAVAVPCRLQGTPVGALGVVSSCTDSAAADEDLAALSLLGSVLAVFTENARVTSYAQKALQAPRDLSERWLKFVEVGPSDLVIVTDLEGFVVDVNQVACRALGYTWHELVRRHLADLLPSPSKDVDLHLLQERLRQIAASELWAIESAFVTKSGRVFPTSVRVRPVEADGQRYLLGVVHDISERKRAEGQLAQTERLHVLGEMAAGMVHDINNTLTAVLGPVDVLLASSSDPLAQQMLPPVRQALLDAANTMGRIQAFARRTSGTAFTAVDLASLVRETVELTRPRWQTHAHPQGITVQVDVIAASAPPVLGSQAELREVLINLISNAVDALPKGGRITLTIESAGPTVALRVSDTGTGIPPDLLPRVFDPFVTTKGARGTGLGLSVVYGIIQRHRGEIQVESTSGQGTTFVITLPVAEEQEVGTAAAEVLPEAPSASAATIAPGALRVLVIDDQRDVAGVLQQMLEFQNHRVRICTSGADGLAALREQAFDLVCTDLNMPGIKGWEVAQGVKAACPALPVALVTGWDDNYEPRELQRLGVDFLLRKPYRLRDVVNLVGQIQQNVSSPFTGDPRR